MKEHSLQQYPVIAAKAEPSNTLPPSTMKHACSYRPTPPTYFNWREKSQTSTARLGGASNLGLCWQRGGPAARLPDNDIGGAPPGRSRNTNWLFVPASCSAVCTEPTMPDSRGPQSNLIVKFAVGPT